MGRSHKFRRGCGGIQKCWVSSTRRRLYELQCGKCFYCLRDTQMTAFTVDHIVPLSRGGGDGITNKVGACEECNAWKADWFVCDEWVSERIDLFNFRDWDRPYRQEQEGERRATSKTAVEDGLHEDWWDCVCEVPPAPA